MGVSVSNEQRAAYNSGLAALRVWNQTTPRFFKDNILTIVASNLKLISPEEPKKSIILLLEQSYKKSPYILSLISSHKHLNAKNGKLFRIKKFIVRYLYMLTARI